MTNITTTEEDKDIKRAKQDKLNRMERATVQGLLLEMDVVKQKLDNCYDKMSRANGAYQTLLNEVRQLRAQYATLANVRINRGPTVKDDGSND